MPSSRNNPDAVFRYEAIRCRVARQVHYSPNRQGESIDLLLITNGVPVATVELETQFTQTVHDANRQYRFDRPPKDPTTRPAEPLLQFKSGAIVHFAVSTEEVYMTTRLSGKDTRLLPFNQGYNEGAGNPPNPDGYKTAYLWEEVFDRDEWLHIIAKFVHLESKGNKETMIFPRFHQWDAVRKIVADVRTRSGRGNRYLVPHSAGSGKSNSIGWLAHHLSSLWVSADRKLFDSVIVVTDRTVLNRQLQETIYQFDHKHGVVERITDKGGAKSTQVAEALAQKKPIIIVTIQTFGKVLEKLGSQEMQDHTFAVIADEAHSSQTGKAAASLKQALGFSVKGAGGDSAADDDEEFDTSEAAKALTRWVRLHPYNIAQKVKIIVEHFRDHVAGRLDGEAKAMVGMPPAAAVPSALSAKQASPFALQPEVITRMVYEAANEGA